MGGVCALLATRIDQATLVQVLQLDAQGFPALGPDGKKRRLTVPAVVGWKKIAAFRIPGERAELVLVEGVEDASAMRCAGWRGPLRVTRIPTRGSAASGW